MCVMIAVCVSLKSVQHVRKQRTANAKTCLTLIKHQSQAQVKGNQWLWTLTRCYFFDCLPDLKVGGFSMSNNALQTCQGTHILQALVLDMAQIWSWKMFETHLFPGLIVRHWHPGVSTLLSVVLIINCLIKTVICEITVYKMSKALAEGDAKSFPKKNFHIRCSLSNLKLFVFATPTLPLTRPYSHKGT